VSNRATVTVVGNHVTVAGGDFTFTGTIDNALAHLGFMMIEATERRKTAERLPGQLADLLYVTERAIYDGEHGGWINGDVHCGLKAAANKARQELYGE